MRRDVDATIQKTGDVNITPRRVVKSCDHCYSKRDISITNSECVVVALVI
jgi:hypothetical protein